MKKMNSSTFRRSVTLRCFPVGIIVLFLCCLVNASTTNNYYITVDPANDAIGGSAGNTRTFPYAGAAVFTTPTRSGALGGVIDNTYWTPDPLNPGLEIVIKVYWTDGPAQINVYTGLTVDQGDLLFGPGLTVVPPFNGVQYLLPLPSNGLVYSEVDDLGIRDNVYFQLLPADTTPPAIAVSATPSTLRPPNGKMVPVIVSGTITDDETGGTGVNASTATYVVTDKGGLVQQSGPVALAGDGSYAFTIPLLASRNGQYTITVMAQDGAGNNGSASTVVTVSHAPGRR